jgi:membrane-anchored protein YejM (alkaline phosphatase superfamily)
MVAFNIFKLDAFTSIGIRFLAFRALNPRSALASTAWFVVYLSVGRTSCFYSCFIWTSASTLTFIIYPQRVLLVTAFIASTKILADTLTYMTIENFVIRTIQSSGTFAVTIFVVPMLKRTAGSIEVLFTFTFACFLTPMSFEIFTSIKWRRNIARINAFTSLFRTKE